MTDLDRIQFYDDLATEKIGSLIWEDSLSKEAALHSNSSRLSVSRKRRSKYHREIALAQLVLSALEDAIERKRL